MALRNLRGLAARDKEGEREAKILRLWVRHFHPYQREFIFDDSLISLWNKARQIGFSHAIAGSALKDALTQHDTNIVLSASQELSSEVLDKTKAHARALASMGLKRARPRISNATRIVLPNKGRVIALPANPRTARSFTGNVYFDEFAYHDDPKRIWDAAAAMKTRKTSQGKRKIRLVSTPNGAQGLFYEWFTTPPKGWRVGAVDIDMAIAQGMRVDLDELWQLAGGDERIFSQWYRLAFLDAAMQYIPTAMADRGRDWKGKIPDLSQCELYAGLDVGRENDLTVLSVIAVFNEMYAFVLPFMSCKRTKFAAQKQMIHTAREMYRWNSLHVDAGGLGTQLAEELVEEFGEDECFPIWFTLEEKADLATRALRWHRDARLKYPRGEYGQLLHKETISVRRVVTPNGNVVYDAPRTSSGHGDRFWATALALRGAGEPQSPLGMGMDPLLAVA